ncbi:hypothetical protein Q8A73_012697 [Channa argus]|nr:hypothetical protein Q8A73_012697 [Channa argus]
MHPHSWSSDSQANFMKSSPQSLSGQSLTSCLLKWEQKLQDEKQSAKEREDKLKKELQDEIQRGKEAENKLNMELNNKTKQLQDEKQSGMKREDKLKKELEEKKKELQDEIQRGKEAENKLNMELNNKTEQWEKLLHDEKQRAKKTEETLKKQVEDKNKQWEKLLHDEKQRAKKTEETLKKQVEDKNKQNSKVLYTMDRSSLRTISVLVVHLLIHFCGGQSQLIGSLQPIVARVGDDIMLPCHVEPVMDVAAKTLEWTRPDLNNILVHVWRSGQELVKAKHPSYTGRTSLFTDELKHGNMSLKLSGVKLSDKGTYKCFIPDLRTQSIVEVVVDAAAPPVISFSGVDESTSEVVLQCESKGWYPQPEVLWLDGEGNVLSAGPTETVRGPDDLYTVSSRVTVDKRHGHRFTCRVQQNIINQTRETHIHVPDDFFKVQSRCSTTTVGLAVSLAVSIMLSLLLLLLLCKKKNMSKRNQMDEVESKDQNWTKQTGRSQAAASWSSSFVVIENHGMNSTFVPKQRFHEEKRRGMEAQSQVQSLKKELEELENITTIDLDGAVAEVWEQVLVVDEGSSNLFINRNMKLQDEIQRGKEAENKLNMEPNKKTEQWEQKLQDEKESAKKREDKLKKELEENKKELQDEIQRGKDAENKLNMELNNKTKQLQDEKQSGMKREDKLKKELEEKKKEWEKLLHDEKQRAKKTEETLKKQVEDKNKQWEKLLHDEKQRAKKTEETLKKQVEDKNKQWEKLLHDEKQRAKKTEETLKKQVEDKNKQSLSGQSLTSCLLKVISQADCFLQGCGEEPTSRMRPIRDSDTEHNTGQSQLIASVQPIVARVGDDIMLPCHLEPAMDVAAKTLEWTRPDLNNIFVHVWRSGQELVKTKHPSYTGRTSLFTDELKHGNMSLKLSGVKLSDKGTYKCFIPDLKTQSTVEVVVASDAAAPPVISFSGVDESTSEVVLQCESKGWYPQPEVLWLDGEGNVLSAGPTETVRGPDDLYTVSSRVTVDKRHGHRFTCRVQQNIINQTRDTHIDVSDDFFKVQSRSSATTVGLAMGRRQAAASWSSSSVLPIVSTKRFREEKRSRMEVQSLNNELETRKQELEEEIKDTNNQLQEEKQKRERAEKDLKTLKNQLEELEGKLTETINQLQKEKQEVETLNIELNCKKEELEGNPTTTYNRLQEEKQKREKSERDLETLNKRHQKLEGKLTKTINELHEEKQEREEEVTTLKNQLKKLEGNLTTTYNQLQEEKQKSEKSERNLETLNKQHKKLQDEKQSGKEREDKLKKELEEKKKELTRWKEANFKPRTFSGKLRPTWPIRAQTLNTTQDPSSS